MNHAPMLLALAFVIDLLVGDPSYRLHPVRLIGRAIERLERVLREGRRDLSRASFLLPLFTVLIATLPYALAHAAFGAWAWALDLYLTYSLLALGDLIKHARRVETALQDDALAAARDHVQLMVGRDASALDAYGVARAAIESVAENFVDGFLSPLFWFGVGTLVSQQVEGGVLLLLTFKAISTLDSMVGYKNERHRVLGRVSARLDDAFNFVPARLSIPLMTFAALLTGRNWRGAWRIGRRDRRQHASPNSAHAEAAMAGALNLRLGGPSIYGGRTFQKPWLGEGTCAATSREIAHALELTRACACAALAATIVIL